MEVIEAHLSTILNTADTAMETKHAARPRRKSALTGSQSVRRGRPRHLWTWKLYALLQTMGEKRKVYCCTWCCINRVQRTVSGRSATILAVLSCLPIYCGTLQTFVMLLCGPLRMPGYFSVNVSRIFSVNDIVPITG